MYQFRPIHSKVTDVKWWKRIIVIIGDSIMSGKREELLKIDEDDVKVRFFRGRTTKDNEENINLS